jgi:hypothetical protein
MDTFYEVIQRDAKMGTEPWKTQHVKQEFELSPLSGQLLRSSSKVIRIDDRMEA